MSETQKQNISIVLDVEFESSNMINGNIIQMAFVAIPNKYEGEDLLSKDWIIDELSVCFEDQPGKVKEENVMAFWAKFPEVRERIRSEAGPISEKMQEVKQWLNRLSVKYNITDFVSDLSCVDFAWFRNIYLTYCTSEDSVFEMPYSCICTSSMDKVVNNFMGYPRELQYLYDESIAFPHTHYALEDARKTGYDYIRLKMLIQRLTVHSE